MMAEMWVKGGERSLEFTKRNWWQGFISKVMAEGLADISPRKISEWDNMSNTSALGYKKKLTF